MWALQCMAASLEPWAFLGSRLVHLEAHLCLHHHTGVGWSLCT